MGEDGQWATSEMGTRNRSGIEGTSIPQRLYEHLKAKTGAHRSALGLRRSSKADKEVRRRRRRKDMLLTCCVYSRVISQKK